MDREIDKIERKNRIESIVYVGGMILLTLTVLGLLSAMVISAL